MHHSMNRTWMVFNSITLRQSHSIYRQRAGSILESFAKVSINSFDRVFTVKVFDGEMWSNSLTSTVSHPNTVHMGS